ncbi:MAG: rod shape-determining protein MreC [Clostridia bacterium]|nr:rod shape-determining protein MreC [Clostridia bacterium]
MKNLWKNRPILIALVASLLFLLLAALTVGRRTAGRGEDLFSSALLPIQSGVGELTDEVTDFFTRVFFPSQVQAENERLKKTVAAYERRLILYEAMEQENARLTELLDYTSANDRFYFLAAPVTAKNLNPYVDTLTIGAGSRNGVKEQMAVVNGQGIVGRVIEVGATYSKVRTMQNEDMRISVMVERTRDEGMLGGLVLSGDTVVGLKLYYLPKDADIQVGDTIVTSGLGGIFPKGLDVGKVFELAAEDNGVYDACVKSEVDFAHLEEVLVILESEG